LITTLSRSAASRRADWRTVMYCRVSTSNRSKSEGFFSSSSFSLSSPTP
jgi:hypothetical protein